MMLAVASPPLRPAAIKMPNTTAMTIDRERRKARTVRKLCTLTAEMEVVTSYKQRRAS
jgi:hypothetical protein